MELDNTVIEQLNRPMWMTWDAICDSAYDICDGDNEVAVELCIDADRLTESRQLVRDLVDEHGYSRVLAFLSENFQFV